MPKNDNAHAIRLVESLKKNNCSELAEQLECQYPLSKSASIEKKFEWAKQACSVLEDNLSEEDINTNYSYMYMASHSSTFNSTISAATYAGSSGSSSSGGFSGGGGGGRRRSLIFQNLKRMNVLFILFD